MPRPGLSEDEDGRKASAGPWTRHKSFDLRAKCHHRRAAPYEDVEATVANSTPIKHKHSWRGACASISMETLRSAIPSDVPAVQGGVEGQGGVAVQGGVVVLPQWFDPRRAVHEQDIMCLVCGKCFRQLTNTHLRSHDLTTASYKIRFGYNRRRPLMSRALRQMYAARAIQSNLASRIRCRPILCNPELRRQGGHRPIALEEVLARRDAQLRRRDDLRAAAARRRARAGAGRAKQGRRNPHGRLTAISRPTARPATRRSSTGRS